MKFRYAIVDDAPFVRELLKSLLSAAGHVCVAESGDGREALEVVARTLPDVIFLDLVMPRKNGIEAAKEIRGLWPEGKIVACTTLEAGEFDRSLFDGYLAKPFTRQDVTALLDGLSGSASEETA